jgi:hypothetical protein
MSFCSAKWPQFVEQKLVLSYSFGCDDLIHDRRTFLSCLSLASMFNKPVCWTVSDLYLVLSYTAYQQLITRGLNLGAITKQIIVPVRLFVWYTMGKHFNNCACLPFMDRQKQTGINEATFHTDSIDRLCKQTLFLWQWKTTLATCT